MIKKSVLWVALALTVLGGSAVYAGMGCNGCGNMFGDNPDLGKVRTFQKETVIERDEMMIKRLELNQELGKKSPDKAKIDALRKEMVELRTKLQAAAGKAGLTGGCLTDCTMDPVDCVKGDCSSCNKKSSKKSSKAKKSAGCSNCNKQSNN